MSRPKEKDATLDWFLIANSDNLSIKIRGAITVGQDDNGVLVLNSPVEAQRWLTLTVDPAGHLVVTEQDPKCKLECPGKWLAHSAGATVPRGTVLELPDNEIYVSEHMHRGQPEQVVIVSRDENAQPAPEPSENAQPLQPVQILESAQTEEQDDTVLAPELAAAHVADDDATVVAQPRPTKVQSGVRRHRKKRKQWILPAVSAAMLLIAGGAWLQWGEDVPALVAKRDVAKVSTTQPAVFTEAPAPAPDAALTAGAANGAGEPMSDLTRSAVADDDISQRQQARDAADLEQAQAVEPAGETEAEAVPEDAVATRPPPVQTADVADTRPTTEAAQDVPVQSREPVQQEPLQPEPRRREAEQLASGPVVTERFDPQAHVQATPEIDIAAELRTARQLLDEDMVIWPAENAVGVIQGILEVDPDNGAALALLDAAADSLILLARQAEADGFDASAIRVVEEVLAFHPRYRPALALRAELRPLSAAVSN